MRGRRRKRKVMIAGFVFLILLCIAGYAGWNHYQENKPREHSMKGVVNVTLPADYFATRNEKDDAGNLRIQTWENDSGTMITSEIVDEGMSFSEFIKNNPDLKSEKHESHTFYVEKDSADGELYVITAYTEQNEKILKLEIDNEDRALNEEDVSAFNLMLDNISAGGGEMSD